MKGSGYIALLAVLAVVCLPMLADAAPNPDGWYKSCDTWLIHLNILRNLYSWYHFHFSTASFSCIYIIARCFFLHMRAFSYLFYCMCSLLRLAESPMSVSPTYFVKIFSETYWSHNISLSVSRWSLVYDFLFFFAWFRWRFLPQKVLILKCRFHNQLHFVRFSVVEQFEADSNIREGNSGFL